MPAMTGNSNQVNVSNSGLLEVRVSTGGLDRTDAAGDSQRAAGAGTAVLAQLEQALIWGRTPAEGQARPGGGPCPQGLERELAWV